MSLEATTRTMSSYLDTLLKRGDFSQFFIDDVLWATVENGQKIQGREAVRNAIVALHTEFFDAQPELRSIAIADGTAALEADFVGVHTAEFSGIPATGAHVRVPYSVFYDVGDEGITALRAYMPLRQMIADLEKATPAES